MLSKRLRSENDAAAWRRAGESTPPLEDTAEFIAALCSGADSRMATDPHTGLSKYFCPVQPTADLICVSSCTASPISARGFNTASRAFATIAGAMSPRQRALRLETLNEQIKAQLISYFGVDGLARVILCPSGTDAVLTAAMLVAAERPNDAITAILPCASETGTGVPMAAMCRVFDGPRSGRSLLDRESATVEIPLRATDGSPLCVDDVNRCFAAATANASGRVIVWLTHGTKTGLIAPVSPPPGADVIVDACQARLAPETVVAYLRRGWPVVVTGSKFFCGPAFSGAVLFPLARPDGSGRNSVASTSDAPSALGTALRWSAAIDAIEAFEASVASMAKAVADRVRDIVWALASNPAVVPIGGLTSHGPGWADQPTIFTFAVRDPADRRRLLSVAELRPLYENLAGFGVLLGQAVGLGQFGGLRIAIGARGLLDDPAGDGLAAAFAVLREVTTQPDHSGGGRRWPSLC
jgi:hypothetical protein